MFTREAYRDKVTLDFWDKIAADVSKTVRQPVKGSRPEIYFCHPSFESEGIL